jgi:hypothetical protein
MPQNTLTPTLAASSAFFVGTPCPGVVMSAYTEGELAIPTPPFRAAVLAAAGAVGARRVPSELGHG